MAIVQGIREKVHLPIYDSLTVEPGKQLRDTEPSSILKFFVDVQKKTKLETNLQSASLLPHYNTFEARAMRVVISDQPPRFSKIRLERLNDRPVLDRRPPAPNFGQIFVNAGGQVVPAAGNLVSADIELPLDRAVELLHEARESNIVNFVRVAIIDANEDGVLLKAPGLNPGAVVDKDAVAAVGGGVMLRLDELEDMVARLEERSRPPLEQIRPNNGSGTIIGKLIYNTVTTLYVGEKIMIQMPTWFFPAGAGPYSESGHFTTHGEPSPTATFRFAEPIFIDKQQNFRVELEIPDTDVLKEIQRIYGPMNIWVVLDGYMTRDVQ
ncbi:MAG TPA: hypothetical protein VJM50_23555 [Pyrinomonadaceae bacterium]|nr:hypothetical protein [Pyrinomonadaceae bacterium]